VRVRAHHLRRQEPLESYVAIHQILSLVWSLKAVVFTHFLDELRCNSKREVRAITYSSTGVRCVAHVLPACVLRARARARRALSGTAQIAVEINSLGVQYRFLRQHHPY